MQSMSEKQIAILRAALRQSMRALDDWLNAYAYDQCDPKRVAQARMRLIEYGTIAYIAKVQEKNRDAMEKTR